jgi:hypothetical protein
MKTLVKLPITQQPIWPDRCAVCGVAAPTDQVTVATILLEAKTPMPVCTDCGRSMRRKMRIERSLFWIGLFTALAIVLWVYGFHRDRDDLLLWKAAVVALWIPWLVLVFWVDTPLIVSAENETKTFGFANAEYAAEFDKLNTISDDAENDSEYDEPPEIP